MPSGFVDDPEGDAADEEVDSGVSGWLILPCAAAQTNSDQQKEAEQNPFHFKYSSKKLLSFSKGIAARLS